MKSRSEITTGGDFVLPAADRRFTIVSTERIRGNPQIDLDFEDDVHISVILDNRLNNWGRHEMICNLDLKRLETARKKLIVGLSQREELIKMLDVYIAQPKK